VLTPLLLLLFLLLLLLLLLPLPLLLLQLLFFVGARVASVRAAWGKGEERTLELLAIDVAVPSVVLRVGSVRQVD
jgi:hypothetical protein